MAYESNKCPICGGPMTARSNKTSGQRFWGCNDFPRCKGTRNTDGDAPRQRTSEHDVEGSDSGELPSERQRRNDRRRW